MGYYHSYDPWSFAGEAKGTFGTASDISQMKNRFAQVSAWSVKNNIPVLLDECGTIKKCDYNSRMVYYATFVEQALNYNIGFNVWDDNGDFQVYIRNNRKWNDLKDVIIHTYKESPTQLKAVAAETSIALSWANRTSENDSIFLDRRTASTDFAPIAKLAPSAAQYVDTGLTPKTTYYYRLRTNLKDSVDLYSYPIVASTLKPTSIEKAENTSFEVYPNPAASIVRVVNNENSSAVLDIYNVNGKKINTITLFKKETTISLKGLAKGNYIFVMATPKGSQSKQVIVQ